MGHYNRNSSGAPPQTALDFADREDFDQNQNLDDHDSDGLMTLPKDKKALLFDDHVASEILIPPTVSEKVPSKAKTTKNSTTKKSTKGKGTNSGAEKK